jgi:hypothetical protein
MVAFLALGSQNAGCVQLKLNSILFIFRGLDGLVESTEIALPETPSFTTRFSPASGNEPDENRPWIDAQWRAPVEQIPSQDNRREAPRAPLNHFGSLRLTAQSSGLLPAARASTARAPNGRACLSHGAPTTPAITIATLVPSCLPVDRFLSRCAVRNKNAYRADEGQNNGISE